uniref:Uncharacterized protein n=1 Tax=Rhizophora mucronata TaxID=61149 RepID=A0A2P2NP35_RHIMU
MIIIICCCRTATPSIACLLLDKSNRVPLEKLSMH